MCHQGEEENTNVVKTCERTGRMKGKGKERTGSRVACSVWTLQEAVVYEVSSNARSDHRLLSLFAMLLQWTPMHFPVVSHGMIHVSY